MGLFDLFSNDTAEEAARQRNAGLQQGYDALSSAEDESRRAALYRALEQLPPRDRRILVMYYGLEDEPMTLDQISKLFGVTRERVRQLRDRALKSLRAHDAAATLHDEWAA